MRRRPRARRKPNPPQWLPGRPKGPILTVQARATSWGVCNRHRHCVGVGPIRLVGNVGAENLAIDSDGLVSAVTGNGVSCGGSVQNFGRISSVAVEMVWKGVTTTINHFPRCGVVGSIIERHCTGRAVCADEVDGLIRGLVR